MLRRMVGPAGALALFIILMTVYFWYLNTKYYASWGPFYDSMSYMSRVADVMAIERREGFAAALRVAELYAAFGMPTVRMLAVFIQLPAYIVATCVGYIYFRDYGKYNRFQAVALGALSVSFARIFFFNCGLYDLRMDLPQALLWASATGLLCVARQNLKIGAWVGFGLVLSAACLFRATTPVFCLAFLPVAVYDLTLGARRMVFLLRYAIALGVVLLTAAWFYVLNYRELYFYYVTWNEDAHANLPLSTSAHHVALACDNLGWLMLSMLSAIMAIELIRQKFWSLPLRRVNWVALLAFAFPIAFLVFRGAGLNPFVSLLAAPAFILFAAVPVRPLENDNFSTLGRTAYIPAAAMVIFLTAQQTGITADMPMAKVGTLRQIVSIVADQARMRSGKTTLAVGMVGTMDWMAIRNVLIFDYGWVPQANGQLTDADAVLDFMPLPLAQHYEWNQLVGATDTERAATLAAQISEKADVFVFPETGTALIPTFPSTPYLFSIGNSAINQGGFSLVASDLAVSDHEKVAVYAKPSS